jgi:glutamyl-tRNA reductase
MALRHEASGPVLNALFRYAIQAGKRARTETAISCHATSVPAVAAILAEKELGSLKNQKVLVIGAGQMGHIAARSLVAHGVKELVIANRTHQRAQELARQLNAEAIGLDLLSAALNKADIVVTTTNAPHTLVTHHQVTNAIAQRPDRPMLIIDIAVPRDIEPTVVEIPGIRLFDIDDLQTIVDDNLEAREKEIPQVEAIAADEAAVFMKWFRTLDVVPTITDLRRQAEALKAQELDKALRRLGDLDSHEREVVCALAHGLVNKLLHEPTIRLKQQAALGQGYFYTSAVRTLFNLEATSTPPGDSGSEGE